MINIESLLEKVNIVDYIGKIAELEKRDNEYWCNSPLNKNDDNPSFSINEEKQIFYCFSTGQGGNILNFIMSYENLDFKSALNKLCDYVGEDVNNISKPASLIKIAKKFKPVDYKNDFSPLKLKSNIMDQYSKEPITEWLSENISQSVLDKYQVRYNKQDNRIVFPIYDNCGNIISVGGRTLDENYKDKKIRKYTYYCSIGTTYFFYGYHQNKEAIESKNEVLVFEAPKSVMKAESHQIFNCIATMTNKISPMQIQELIKIKVKNIVICFDKDVSLSQIQEKLKLLTKFKNAYVVIDTLNLLGDKDSPIDLTLEIFNRLYENRIRLR